MRQPSETAEGARLWGLFGRKYGPYGSSRRSGSIEFCLTGVNSGFAQARQKPALTKRAKSGTSFTVQGGTP